MRLKSGEEKGGVGKYWMGYRRNFASKCSESLEMQRRGRLRVRGKILSVAMKYWVRAKPSKEEEPVRQWYERQIGTLDKETQ